MSISLTPIKTKQLTTKDFIPDTYAEEDETPGYRMNNVVLGSVADFYNVSNQEKETLFALDKGFHEVAFKFADNQISIDEYLQEVSRLNELSKEFPNIQVKMNKDKKFEVFLESELKYEHQTFDQKAATDTINALKAKKPTILALYGIEWEESERGWGTRPDGFSFHRSEEESEQYLKEFFARQPKEVPDEYSRPLGKARLIQVSESLHDYVMSNGSVWLAPKDEKAYKNYDASHLTKPKKKM